jgi:hypothetical protein
MWSSRGCLPAAESDFGVLTRQAALSRILALGQFPIVPAGSMGPALVANALCRGQENLVMHEPEVQIGNSGLNAMVSLLWISPQRHKGFTISDLAGESQTRAIKHPVKHTLPVGHGVKTEILFEIANPG